MAGAAVQITGLREAQKALGQIDSEVRKELREALRGQARKVADRYRSNINSRSGTLAGKVSVRARPTGASVGSTLIYAPVVEFGWRPRFKPRHWLMGAIEQMKPEIEREAPRAIDEILERLFEREALQ